MFFWRLSRRDDVGAKSRSTPAKHRIMSYSTFEFPNTALTSPSPVPHDVPFTWNRHDCSGNPLNLSATLGSGQSFRWRKDEAGIWWGVVGQSVVAAWQAQGQPDSPLFWQTFPQPDRREIVMEYFRLNVDLEALYIDWARTEPRITRALVAYRGLRILRQPPEECFIAFQCAAANNVPKISHSVTHLARYYGAPVENPQSLLQPFYAFPSLETLATADEVVLRTGLWGYRAPRVIANARELARRPSGWLISLREASYAEAHAELISLFGIGAKIADCICLFALDKDNATPVDTHIHRIAVRLFAPELAGKSLTPRIYGHLSSCFQDRFAPYAGWAQQYLFFEALTGAFHS